LSVHFKTPVSHLQPVKAFMEIKAPTFIGEKQRTARIWMEHLDGRVVLEGTASCGLKKGQETTEADKRMQQIKPVKGKLVWNVLDLGSKSSTAPVRIDFGKIIDGLFPFTVEDKLEIITEYSPWYAKEFGVTSPWGRPIVTLEGLNQIMLIPKTKFNAQPILEITPVELFGGCEVRIVNGPVFMEEDYDAYREIIAYGETPKAEFNWTRTTLCKKNTSEVVAEMLLQSLQLKVSIPGYEALRKEAGANLVKAKL